MEDDILSQHNIGVVKMAKDLVAKQEKAALGAPAAPKAPKKVPGLEARIKPTGMNHIVYFDINDDGRLREVALVKMDKNQDGTVRSVYYIDVALLDNIDKGRLKSIVTNQHADKYQLWDLLSQQTLSNGKNALDYFHQLTRVTHGVGAVTGGAGGGIASAHAESSSVIGSEFSPPDSASLDGQPA
jgi:hypothetical protein